MVTSIRSLPSCTPSSVWTLPLTQDEIPGVLCTVETNTALPDARRKETETLPAPPAVGDNDDDDDDDNDKEEEAAVLPPAFASTPLLLRSGGYSCSGCCCCCCFSVPFSLVRQLSWQHGQSTPSMDRMCSSIGEQSAPALFGMHSSVCNLCTGGHAEVPCNVGRTVLTNHSPAHTWFVD